MEKEQWSLLNGELLGQVLLRPDYNTILQHLTMNSFIKLIFKTNRTQPKFIGLEQLWLGDIRLVEGYYQGRLFTIPRTTKGLYFGQLVSFYPEHVISCFRSFHFKNKEIDLQRGLISKDILWASATPQLAIREFPSDVAGDSGWRIFSSNRIEPDLQLKECCYDYLEKFENKEPLLRNLCKTPIGKAWFRDRQNGFWKEYLYETIHP